ncbi:hypothetical protein GOP47_0025991 [Adiantum capillus-veneris]|uniref:Uncharacterized protein n=1 Tax=Adiantum capillus-veneris TaxID=13818 RepID=A0A9D4U1M1_ADICA|nr:hypothetical protein GOP47_0025991 [Adiantum capillus-veneris]
MDGSNFISRDDRTPECNEDFSANDSMDVESDSCQNTKSPSSSHKHQQTPCKTLAILPTASCAPLGVPPKVFKRIQQKNKVKKDLLPKSTQEGFSNPQADKGKLSLDGTHSESTQLDPEDHNLNLVPHSPSAIPLLHISEISESNPRFVLEGKIFNRYGTYKVPPEQAKYGRFLKVDLVDVQCMHTITLVVGQECMHTITLVVGQECIEKYSNKLSIGEFIKVENLSVKPNNKNDGGIAPCSLYLDTAAFVIKVEPFPVSLSFCPETSIRAFLDEAPALHGRGIRMPLTTVAFVIIHREDPLSTCGTGRAIGDLLVADGPTSSDTAILSFVNERKTELQSLLEDLETDDVCMYVARNVGSFKR